ncbi:MAG TPA: RNA polymerase sigma factor [Methylomirabilota bacterium]|nr:RNA polymerase sigma factor [Methylomirabilota bacterium]
MSHDQFDTLVAMHHGEIHRYLLLITGSGADADDLSQETFIQAFKTRRSSWHVTGARQELFAIATGLSRSRLRSRRGEARRATEKEHRHPVAMAMTRLPAEQRIALALRKLHDFDYEWIGRMLGCSSENARRRAARGFRRLADERCHEAIQG